MKVDQLPRIPKYSNWEEYLADPGRVLPKLAFGFEINKGGRPSIHVEQQAPKYDFAQNEWLTAKLKTLRTKSKLHLIRKPETQTSVTKYHHRRVLTQL